MYKYSINEHKLFDSFNVNYHNYPMNPMEVYRSLVQHIFINNLSGPNVEAVRRAFIAMQNLTAFRGTEEFEKLITF